MFHAIGWLIATVIIFVPLPAILAAGAFLVPTWRSKQLPYKVFAWALLSTTVLHLVITLHAYGLIRGVHLTRPEVELGTGAHPAVVAALLVERLEQLLARRAWKLEQYEFRVAFDAAVALESEASA